MNKTFLAGTLFLSSFLRDSLLGFAIALPNLLFYRIRCTV